MYLSLVYNMQSPSRSHDSQIPTGIWDWNNHLKPHPFSPILVRFFFNGIEYRIDYLSLALVLALLGGLGFVAITLTHKFNDGLQATRDSLKKQGLNVTSQGVSVKTNKAYDQERYLDDTQQKLVNVVKASSFGTVENKQSLADLTVHSHAAPKVPGVKKGLFGRTKTTPLPAK